MNVETLLDYQRKQFEKHTVACGQLGTYESLVHYAIKALRGETASSPSAVADYIEERQGELIKEQFEKLFPNYSKALTWNE